MARWSVSDPSLSSIRARDTRHNEFPAEHWFIYIYGRLRAIRAVIARSAFIGLAIRLPAAALAGFGRDSANPDALAVNAPGAVGGPRLSLKCLLEFLGRPKSHLLAGLDLDGLPRRRVAPHMGRPGFDLQNTKAAHADPIALL